jgi:hypothetical protein
MALKANQRRCLAALMLDPVQISDKGCADAAISGDRKSTL